MSKKHRDAAPSGPPAPARATAAPVAAGPDVSQLQATELPAAPFPGAGGQRFRVFFSPAVHGRLWQHAGENTGVEICGVLVGKWGRDAEGPFVAVSEAIRGEAATSKFAEVTFTHETWAKINQEMDTKFTDLSIVGWYHTHPDFGVFLSDRDVFIQQHFFSGPGQIAHVIDPIRKTEGVFVWGSGRPVLAPYFWVGDRLVPGEAGKGTGAHEAGATAAPAPRTEEGWGGPILNNLLLALPYVAVFLLGYILAGRLTDSERLRTKEDAIAQAALLMGVKPGLRESLTVCLDDLEGAAREAEALAGKAGDDDKEKWREARTRLARAFQRLMVIQDRYSLSAAETDRLLQYAAAVLAANTPGLSPRELGGVAQQYEKALKEGVKQGLFELPTLPGGDAAKKSAPAEAGKGKAGGAGKDDKAGTKGTDAPPAKK